MAEADTATDPLVGKVLNGRFTILEPLGVGGMGKVYKAIQAPLDRVVALKVLNPSYSGSRDPGFQRRFFLEASLTSKLHHPNTITVHDYGRTDDGIFYIAMEYVEGQTLAQVLAQQGRLPAARALRVAQQICRSLREAHRLGVVHRDLKPANIMLLNEETERDLVKVLDFGLVKSFLPESETGVEKAELTQAGVLMGSPMYMAPEQAKNQSGPRSDIYSLGVVLYQMLAGRAPFVGKESIEVIVKHIRESVPPLRSHAPEVPAEVEAVVLRCLEKDPAKRYPSMDALIEAMRAAASAAGISGAFSNARSQALSNPGQALGPHSEPVSLEFYVSPWARWKVPGAIVAGVLFLGGAVAVLATRSGNSAASPPGPPASAPGLSPTPVAPEVARAPRAAPVRFEVSSSPPGARVTHAGKNLGPTPLMFEVSPGVDGRASAELTFALEGYQGASVSAQGAGPVVRVEGRLERKPSGKVRPPRRTNPAGYKEDPYQ